MIRRDVVLVRCSVCGAMGRRLGFSSTPGNLRLDDGTGRRVRDGGWVTWGCPAGHPWVEWLEGLLLSE